MEDFENTEFEQEIPVSEDRPEEPQFPEWEDLAEPGEPDSAACRDTGAGKKESPFAASPYMTREELPRYRAPGQEPSQEPQEKYTPRYAAPKVKKKAPKGRSPWWKVLACAAALAVVAGSCLITAASVNSYWEARNQQTVSQMEQKLQALQDQINALSPASGGTSVSGSPVAFEGLTPSQVYARNVDSVVAISSSVTTAGFYGASEGTATGSGFILTEDGYVVTNHHVIEGATAISVITHDGTEYPAELVGSDSTNDVAVLKVEAQGLPAATLGSSDSLIIGDMVVAIGNPLGELTSTQTVGYVSGKDRDVTTDNTIINMLQVDAAINSGNSGGPLFNMRGEVVGITTAKYSGTSGSGASIEGIGFAIPIDDVKGIISDLKDRGYVTGAYLGVTVSDTDAESAAMFGLPVGAYIVTVETGAAADRAGIQPKDILIQLGEHQVSSVTTLTRALRNFKAGDTTTATVVRSGQKLELTITLDEKPQTSAAETLPQTPQSQQVPDNWFNWPFSGNG